MRTCGAKGGHSPMGYRGRAVRRRRCVVGRPAHRPRDGARPDVHPPISAGSPPSSRRGATESAQEHHEPLTRHLRRAPSRGPVRAVAVVLAAARRRAPPPGVDAPRRLGGLPPDGGPGRGHAADRADRRLGLLRHRHGRAGALGAGDLRRRRGAPPGPGRPHADGRARPALPVGASRPGVAGRRPDARRGGGPARSARGRRALPRAVGRLHPDPHEPPGPRAARAAADDDLRPHRRHRPGPPR